MPKAERTLSRNVGLAAIVGLILVFGAITEIRAAFLEHRHTGVRSPIRLPKSPADA
jgi:hypothetical protein